jgi:hypothetical protein
MNGNTKLNSPEIIATQATSRVKTRFFGGWSVFNRWLWEKDISLTFLESGLFKASIAASCQRSVHNFHSTSGDDVNMGDIEIQKAVNP